MKSVIKSLHPEVCERIVSGEQTVIVAKSVPKEVPFKGYIYCTKGKINFVSKIKNSEFTIFNGYVIGEFTCNNVDVIEPDSGYFIFGYASDDLLESMCLTQEDLQYYGRGKTLYGWHISDLKIYDKPKELGEFSKYKYKPLGGCCQNHNCKNYIYNGYYQPPECKIDGCFLKRPPQSWQYVEEL